MVSIKSLCIAVFLTQAGLDKSGDKKDAKALITQSASGFEQKESSSKFLRHLKT